MQTTPVTSNYQSALNGGSTAKTRSSALGKDEFLKLLMAQLQNQDPLKPADQQDFINQLAQFSQMEQTINLNKSITNMLNFTSFAQGASLIGKTVTAQDPDTGDPFTGRAQSVLMAQGVPYVRVDGKPVKMDQILSVSE